MAVSVKHEQRQDEELQIHFSLVKVESSDTSFFVLLQVELKKQQPCPSADTFPNCQCVTGGHLFVCVCFILNILPKDFCTRHNNSLNQTG